MLLRVFIFLFLATIGHPLLGQTFSRTYKDTFALSGLSGVGVEYNDNFYACSSGGGLNLAQGNYYQIVKIKENGDVADRFFSYSETRSYSDGARFLITNSNDFIVSLGESVKGSISPRGVVIVKLTENFDTIWHYRHSDTTQFDSPYGIFQDKKGYIYIAGVRNLYQGFDPDTFDGFLLILTGNGELVDFITYDEGDRDVFNSLVPCRDGGYFLGGATDSFSGQVEGYLVKVDSLGNKLWSKNYPAFAEPYFSSFSNNKLIVSGFKQNVMGRTVLGMVDTSGAIIWTKNYSFSGSPAFYRSICTRKKDIVAVGIATIAGEGNSGFILSVDSTGEPHWNRRYNYNEFTDFFSNVIETSDGGFLVNGSARDTDGSGQNLWLVKLDSMGCLEPNCWEVGIEDAKENELGIKVFPNPAGEWLNFKLPENIGEIALEVFSVSGLQVMNTILFAPLEAIQVSHLTSGLYLVKLTNKHGDSSTQRIIIAR